MKLLLVFALALSPLAAQQLPVADPAQAGLSKERLARIAPYMNKQIEENHMSGAIGLVIRNGKVAYFEPYGFMDKDAKKPMQKNAIFRMYSMTKAVTGVAVMMLMEEGKFVINDPVSKYLPEFAKPQVAVVENGRVTSTVPAEREMTIRDLMRHTSGVVDYVGLNDKDGESYLRKANIYDPSIDLAEFCRRLAKIPLSYQPGTTFQYGYSIDVLGRLVEVVSGKRFEDFLDDRIFKPLGMVDTGFYVPESKWGRFVIVDAGNPRGIVRRGPAAAQEAYKKKPAAALGGQGMVSTAMDYARFTQMLLNGGVLDGKRILGRKSVELMHMDHLGDLARGPGIANLAPGTGFGLTFAVTKDPGKLGVMASAGEYYWAGAAGTRFWIDPKEKMITIFMVNIMPLAGSGNIGPMFKVLAYQAIAD